MSTDWSKYTRSEETQQRASSAPNDNGVVRLQVGRVRAIDELLVTHTPLRKNRAHTDVTGPVTSPESRVKLLRDCRAVIPVPDPLP